MHFKIKLLDKFSSILRLSSTTKTEEEVQFYQIFSLKFNIRHKNLMNWCVCVCVSVLVHRSAVFQSPRGLCSRWGFHTAAAAVCLCHHKLAGSQHSRFPYPSRPARTHNTQHTTQCSGGSSGIAFSTAAKVKTWWATSHWPAKNVPKGKTLSFYKVLPVITTVEVLLVKLSLLVFMAPSCEDDSCSSRFTLMAWKRNAPCMASRMISIPLKENDKLDRPPLTLAFGRVSYIWQNQDREYYY